MRVQIRRELDALRELLSTPPGLAEAEFASRVEEVTIRVEAALEAQLGSPIRRVLNATGIFIHTNLGRSPLPGAVAGRLPHLLDAYCDLEFDLESGKRSERNRGAAALLRALTGAEAAIVVNNNAAALVLILAALARDREVIVSRGELVEIGGSFRIPDILRAAGARLIEVGATNRTRLSDYEKAIGPDTAMLLKVHTSNYRQVGFVASVAEAELAGLARSRELLLVADEGGGLLRPHPSPQLAKHPSMTQLLEAGCDLVCGSGDKLLGGPQAGLILGKAAVVERCRRHPLYRALRPDRAGLATLEGVLRLHLAGEPMPVDGLWPDPASHRRRLDRVAAAIGAQIVTADAYLGGGAAPAEAVPGEALAFEDDPALLSRLRCGQPPVVGYIRHGRMVLDLRTVALDEDAALIEAVQAARSSSSTSH